MGKILETSSVDVYADFIKKFSEKEFCILCELLNINDDDIIIKNIQYRDGSIDYRFNKKQELGCEIMLSYILYLSQDKEGRQDKSAFTATKKKKLLSLKNNTIKLKNNIKEIYKDVTNRSQSEHDILTKLRSTARRIKNDITPKSEMESITARYEVNTDVTKVYDFDNKIKELIDTLEWLERCSNNAANLFIPKDKPKSRNIYEISFFRELSNIYYTFTGKVPTLKYSGSNPNNGKDLVEGDVLGFYRICYRAFNIKISDKALFDKLTDFTKSDCKKDEQEMGMYHVKPAWN